mmetsp:Transcript_4907/g.17795  ORF Transcript_4907/g.17795 Transcript_4907/m.17795 type:complete len:135 (-) Transcript_4907:3-407(-)
MIFGILVAMLIVETRPLALRGAAKRCCERELRVTLEEESREGARLKACAPTMMARARTSCRISDESAKESLTVASSTEPKRPQPTVRAVAVVRELGRRTLPGRTARQEGEAETRQVLWRRRDVREGGTEAGRRS